MCGGACCKSFKLPVKLFDSDDVNRWLELHASDKEGEALRFDTSCNMLCDGKCSIYKERPQMCKDYAVGSQSCREAIQRHGRYSLEEFSRMFAEFQ